MNTLRTTILAGFGLVFASLTPAAAATSAFVGVTISEYAGPSTYYPVVSVIPSGATVTMYGCYSGGSWCDVSYAGARGWVPGGYLEVYYQAEPVYVPYYVTVVVVPIVVFEIDVYWNDYYRDRPFFVDRDRYVRYAHSPAARVAAVALTGPGAKKGAKFAPKPAHMPTVATNGRAQTLAAAGPKPQPVVKTAKVVKKGNVVHPMVATGPHPMVATGRTMKLPQGPVPSKFGAAPRGGPKRPPCPRGHACML